MTPPGLTALIARRAVLVLLAAAPSLRAQTNTTDLAALRQTFEQNLQKIEDDAAFRVAAWPDEYIRELKALQKARQAAGDFEGWKTLDAELSRFKADPRLDAETRVAEPAELKSLQAKYGAVGTTTATDKSRKVLALGNRYIERLTQLQKQLTVAGKMEDALEVNAEIKRVRKLPAFTAAEFMVAESEARSAPPAAAEPAPEAPPAEPAKQAPTVTSLDDGTKIYDGARPPSLPGLTYKAVTLWATGRATGKRVSVSASLAKKSDVSRSSESGFGSMSQSKSGSVQYCLRLAVNSTVGAFSLSEGRVQVQYFVRDLESSGGKISPDVIETQTIPLPPIDSSRTVYVDCTPVSVYVSSYKYRSAYSSYGSSYTSGQEFYGIVIGVFDKDNALVGQYASTDTLGKLATTDPPSSFERRRQGPRDW